jgi:hypothetical protein
MSEHEMNDYNSVDDEGSLDDESLLHNRQRGSRHNSEITEQVKHALMGSMLVMMLLMLGFMVGYNIHKLQSREVSSNAALCEYF